MANVSTGIALVGALKDAKTQYSYVDRMLTDIQSQTDLCIAGEAGDAFKNCINSRKSEIVKINSLIEQIIIKINNAIEAIREREREEREARRNNY